MLHNTILLCIANKKPLKLILLSVGKSRASKHTLMWKVLSKCTCVESLEMIPPTVFWISRQMLKWW